MRPDESIINSLVGANFTDWLSSKNVIAMLDSSKIVASDGDVLGSINNTGASSVDFTGSAKYISNRTGYAGGVIDLSGSTIESAGWSQTGPYLILFVGEWGEVGTNARLWSNQTQDVNRQEFYSSTSSTNGYYASVGNPETSTSGVLGDAGQSSTDKIAIGVYVNGSDSSLIINGRTEGVITGTFQDVIDGIRIGGDSNGGRLSSPIVSLFAVVTGLEDSDDALLGASLSRSYVATGV